jgi:hypothetical protein
MTRIFPKTGSTVKNYFARIREIIPNMGESRLLDSASGEPVRAYSFGKFYDSNFPPRSTSQESAVERVRAALAAIKADKNCAAEVIAKGVREAPEVFIPGLAYFVAHALHGEVISPEFLPPPE